MSELRLELELKETPVTLVGKDGEETFYLIEMDGRDRDEYVAWLQKKVQFGDDAKVKTVKSMDGIQTKLLTLCLHKEDRKTKASKSFIQGLPSRVVDQLAEEANKLSGLEEDEEAEEGND